MLKIFDHFDERQTPLKITKQIWMQGEVEI